MAKGDVYLFKEAMLEFGKAGFDLPNDTLKVGLIDNTAAPTVDDVTPTWADYVANEVATTGNYTANGETLTSVVWALVGDVPTLSADDIIVAMHASGFTDAYWGIIYDDTNGSDHALGFVDLGGPENEQAGPVTIEWTDGDVLELPANVAA